jgi:hypothetical protein
MEDMFKTIYTHPTPARTKNPLPKQNMRRKNYIYNIAITFIRFITQKFLDRLYNPERSKKWGTSTKVAKSKSVSQFQERS